MDTKRLLLALGISMVAMWLYTTFIAKAPEKPAPQPTAQTETQQAAKTSAQTPGTTVPATTLAPAPGAAPAQQAAPLAVNAKDVIVDTPLLTAYFSERGATLRKVVLKRYYNEAGKQGGNFVLIDLEPGHPYSLGLVLPKVDPQLANRQFTPDKDGLKVDSGKAEISFSAQAGDVQVVKTFRFSADSYAFEMNVTLVNAGGQRLEITPEVTLHEYVTKGESNSYAFTGIQAYKDNKLVELDKGDLEDKKAESGDITWAGLSVPYFMGVVLPQDAEGTAPKRSISGSVDGRIMNAILVNPPQVLEPGAQARQNYLVYYGPKDLDILEPLGHNLTAAVDFGWFDILAQPMLVVLKFIYGIVGNYGIAIIIVTILVKILFWPVTAKMTKSMNDMRKLQPQVAKLREKYKEDKQRMNQEIMQLYKTYKVNPMGGCLPMLVQIPVFIAFYQVLGNSIELWHAPFMLWINDLAAPDRLPIGIIIPYVGNGIPVLTLLMGASMFIQQKMTPTMGDPAQAKMMMLMPIFFTFIFINFPAGLVLYWLVNNVLTIGQQWFNARKQA